MAERETWATGAGKPPRKVVGGEIFRAAQEGADLHTVKAEPVKMKGRRKDAKKVKKAETAQVEKKKGK